MVAVAVGVEAEKYQTEPSFAVVDLPFVTDILLCALSQWCDFTFNERYV